MSHIKSFISAVCLLLISTASYHSQAESASDRSDLRVLIDISGSMKENDPENLRAPALKLLVGLLPDNVDAGVWTFGTGVKPIVKHKNVDKTWKSRALKASDQITSDDLFTNIEQALRAAIKDVPDDESANRNLILLTDGMVDLKDGEEANDDSRARILTDLMDQLKAKNITVHTIALSDNADHELSDQLALGTDGWAEKVENADQLQRIFLRMFEKSTPQETVPLIDNKFTIDSAIEEFTLLVFKKSTDKITTITQPDGTSFESQSIPEDAVWYEEEGYDLVTVTTPMPGEWSIDADFDPDNRVMVVTDLKLNTTDFPNSVFLGEAYDFQVWLSSEGKVIDRDDFYDVLSIEMLQEANGVLQEIWTLIERDAEQKYHQDLGQSFEPGRASLRIIVDGKTFQREKIHTVEVYEQPLKIDAKADVRHNKQHLHLIKIKPIEDLVHGDSVTVNATINKPDGTQEITQANSSLLGTEWLVEIKDPMPGEYAVVLAVQAEGKHGRPISFTSETYRLGERVPDQVDFAEEKEPEPATDLTEEAPISDEEIAESEPAEEEESSVDWMTIAMYVGGANVIIGVIGLAVWIYIRKRRRMMAEPGEEL